MNRKFLSILSLIMFLLILGSCKTVPKNDPNFLGDFSPVELGTIMAGTVTRIKEEIKPTEFKFTFFPRTNIISIQHKFMVDKVEIFLDQGDREILIKAMETYLSSYNDKNLSAANAKKKAFFGKTKVYMTWGLFGGGAHEAEPTLRAEYQLLSENRPYFILGNASTKAVGEKDDASSPALRLAFSPAQCEDFIELLKQENLVKIVEDMQKDFERFEPSQKTENQNTENSEEDKVNYDGF
ncbi:hypothetical protein [Treponema putidum]|uniref:Lipoprotein n=1 Tax=Treponema putidum TaxID=221027 RepID=A0AAE9MTP6_9SPIR|nr:hypothetical protein [Treponema putidum]AIN94642.1 hypothetical protein JO40_11525 [Treponema putidum]TWI78753.1 hypothetical protein JM98_00330 [Treponema putidum]UTY28665.1 hypothetical protein E4N76_06405 [Treponema putidum]UTY32492.1 hypothetical protein E4N75_05855 [Treponema putidum]UTY33530.1 hypothetical protein E4N74_05485 [Treponema putidum]